MTTAQKTAPKTVAKKATKTAKASATAVNEQTSQTLDAVNAAAETATSNAQDVMGFGTETFRSVMTYATEQSEEMRGRFDAMADVIRERADATRQHLAETNTDVMNSARDELNDAMQFTTDIAKARSVADMLEIQRDFVSSMFETRMERMRDYTDAMMTISRENAEIAREKLIQPMVEAMPGVPAGR